MAARYAVYFAPHESTALWRAGCRWLGRDPCAGAGLAQPEVDGWSAERIWDITASPRLYGFHATLKPPFALAEGRTGAQLADAVQELAARLHTFVLPQLAITSLDGFLALQPTAGSTAELSALADACVIDLDGFRRPPPAEELVQRRAAGLSPRQDQLLVQFGYPFVLDQFRFHMTLTERLPRGDAIRLSPWLSEYFTAATASPLLCDAICLFLQERPAEAFVLLQRFALNIR
jgi:putative phosphonate metabolism protein